MASAEIYRYSGEGDRYGLSGIDGHLTYVATIDAMGDDPVEPVAALMPIGTPHPQRTRSSLVVYDYAKRRQMDDPLVWLVDVIFESRHKADIGGWRIEVDIGGGTQHMTRDLNGVFIGSKVFRPVKEEETPTHYTKVAEPINGSTVLQLIETDAIHPAPYDCEGDDMTFAFSQTCPRMTMQMIRVAHMYRRTVNSVTFESWPKHTVLCLGATIREVPAIMPGQQETGLVYPTRLLFSVSTEGWRDIVRYSTWIDDKGNESLIFQSVEGPPTPEQAEPVHTTHPVRGEANFYDLMKLLGGSTPKRDTE
jgi:hypothetical protein